MTFLTQSTQLTQLIKSGTKATPVVFVALALSACKTTEDYYNDGFQDGVAKGEEAGYSKGYQAGKNDGINLGKQQGREIGLVEGYDQGYHDGNLYFVKNEIVPTMGGGVLIAIAIITAMLLIYIFKRYLYRRATDKIDSKIGFDDNDVTILEVNKAIFTLKNGFNDLPKEANQYVQNICDGVSAVLLMYIEKKNMGIQGLYTIKKIVIDYVPTTIQKFQTLPNNYQLANGKSTKTALLEQLKIIDDCMRDIVTNTLADKEMDLLANQRFLEKRLKSSKW